MNIDDFLDPLLRAFDYRLGATIQGHKAEMYLAGSAQMMSYGRTIMEEKPIFYEGPPMQDAVNYAQRTSATLVRQIDDTTRDELKKIISEGIANKRGVPGLSRDIRNKLDEMSRDRAKMIARTESCDSLEAAFMDRSKVMGVTGKRWVTHDPCPVCTACEELGDVPIDFEYPHEGIDPTRPPAHPNCMCALAPVMLE